MRLLPHMHTKLIDMHSTESTAHYLIKNVKEPIKAQRSLKGFWGDNCRGINNDTVWRHTTWMERHSIVLTSKVKRLNRISRQLFIENLWTSTSKTKFWRKNDRRPSRKKRKSNHKIKILTLLLAMSDTERWVWIVSSWSRHQSSSSRVSMDSRM